MEQLVRPEALGWVALLLALGLVRAPPMAGPGLEVAFAVQVALAMLYDPPAAAATAALGAVDLRLDEAAAGGVLALPLALVTVAAGGVVFHRLAGTGEPTARLLAAFAAYAALMWLVVVAALAAAGGPARVAAPRQGAVHGGRLPRDAHPAHRRRPGPRPAGPPAGAAAAAHRPPLPGAGARQPAGERRQYPPRPQPCELGARPAGDRLVLWVRDHGAGSRFTVVLPVRHPGAPQRAAAP
jgi:hypothetical protein